MRTYRCHRHGEKNPEDPLWLPRRSTGPDGHLPETQSRDFDALIAHTSIVFMRYMFLAYQIRIETDHRTFGDLFYACCDEMADISFIEALYRIMTLAGKRIRKIGSYCEKTASAIFDAIIETALQCVGLSKSNGVKATA